MSILLDIQHVKKQYEGHLAVADVNLRIPEGVIFGLLGPNGAGKTTLIRMINGITRPDNGRILLRDKEITGVLHQGIGYLPEERGLYKKMKVAEQLVYLAQLKGMQLAEAKKVVKYWLEKFDMMDWRRKTIEELSKGMQQKIQFIATIQHDPDLIILDEPFTGLDPVNTNLIKGEIRNLRDAGKSIIFSTHRMEQVEEICEQIALINAGRNILEGEVDKIKQDHKEGYYRLKIEGELSDLLEDKIDVQERDRNAYIFKLKEGQSSTEVLKLLIQENIEVLLFEELLPSLNDVFIKTVAE